MCVELTKNKCTVVCVAELPAFGQKQTLMELIREDVSHMGGSHLLDPPPEPRPIQQYLKVYTVVNLL